MSVTDLAVAQYARDHADNQDVLGRLVLSTVSELTVAHDTVAVHLNRYGLGEYLGGVPADSDIFRRVTKTIQSREDLGDGTFLNVLVRDVTHGNTNEIVRRVVAENVDPKGKRLAYTEVWDLTFDKEHGTLTTRRTPDWIPTAADDIVAGLGDEYQAKRGTLNGDGIRALIKKILVGSHAIPIHRGASFMPRQHMGATDAIQSLAREFPEVDLLVVPLPNGSSEVHGVSKALGEDTDRAITALMDQANEIAKAGKARQNTLATMGTELRRLKARTQVYQELLETDLSELDTRLLLLDQAVGAAIVAAS